MWPNSGTHHPAAPDKVAKFQQQKYTFKPGFTPRKASKLHPVQQLNRNETEKKGYFWGTTTKHRLTKPSNTFTHIYVYV